VGPRGYVELSRIRSISGIMMSMSTMLRSGVLGDELNRHTAAGRGDNPPFPWFLEEGSQGEDVARIIVGHKKPSGRARPRLEPWMALEHNLLLLGQVSDYAGGGTVLSRRADAPATGRPSKHNASFAMEPEAGSAQPVFSFFAGKDYHRQARQ